MKGATRRPPRCVCDTPRPTASLIGSLRSSRNSASKDVHHTRGGAASSRSRPGISTVPAAAYATRSCSLATGPSKRPNAISMVTAARNGNWSITFEGRGSSFADFSGSERIHDPAIRTPNRSLRTIVARRCCPGVYQIWPGLCETRPVRRRLALHRRSDDGGGMDAATYSDLWPDSCKSATTARASFSRSAAESASKSTMDGWSCWLLSRI
jgi:hypothetical protein